MIAKNTISRKQFYKAMSTYYRIVNSFPENIQEWFPANFDSYLLPHDSSFFTDRTFDVELTSLGMQRYEMLASPHARTLLMAWAIRAVEGGK